MQLIHCIVEVRTICTKWK